MQQIADWLQKLGLGQYAQRFAENEIDVSVLPHLTDQDLKEIGVPLGPRRKILAAIAAETGTTNETPEPAASIEPKAQDTAERRQVTVMFSDLVGSTALSARMDPEDLREVISAYQKSVAETVQRFGGFVAKYMGDGVLVYFGYPQAHEDDAERAVRAGLELVAAIGGLKTHAPLQTRIGIATGLVVVGDLIGSGASQEQAIVGETPNLAARLQGIAEPNSVVFAESTRKLVGNLFELQDVAAQDLKGIVGPVRAWTALRPASVESRFDALHASGLTKLVGREEELELLLRRWLKAKAGEGQVVLLSGEPGIGKSRLTAALMERLATEPHTRLRYFCSPQHTDSALYPIISQMERAAEFAHDDTVQAKLDKLDALLAQSSTSHQDAALFAEMLSIPNDGRYPTLELTPQQRRQKTLEALTVQLEALSRSNPVLMIFEDAHWTDPTSLEVLGRMADRLKTLGVLLTITYRPEFEPPWVGLPHVAALTLNRLGEHQIGVIIDGIAGNKALPESIRRDIIERTDGIPLFVEEMTKAVLEAGGEEAADLTAAIIPSSVVAVPASLHASLMARLDRLGPAKEVAQIGAAIGREFSYELMAAVAHRTDAELRTALGQLVDSGLAFCRGQPPQATYWFKHALLQDAAYGTLLREPRRALHARIVETIESQFDEIAENQPELLAHHFGEAGLAGPACDYRMRAGDRAVSRSAYKEAIAHFSVGAKSAEALPEPAESMRRQLDFLLKLGAALMVVRGVQSAEVEDAYRRASEIGDAIADTKATFKAKWGLWYNANIRARTALTRERADELITLAEYSGDSDLLLEAYHCRWATAFFRGDVAAALHDSRIGADSYNLTSHRHLGAAFGGHDPGVCAHAVIAMALVLQMSGDSQLAKESMARGLALAERLDHPASVAHALSTWAYFHQFVADREATLEIARRLGALAEKFGLMPHRSQVLLLSAWANATGSGAAEAARLIDAEIDQATAVGPFPRYYLGLAAEVLLAAGRPADGLAQLDRAIATIDEPGVGFYLPEIYRLRGECLLALSRRNKAKARQAFVTARDVARLQGATLFGRRAKTRLVEMGK